MVTIVSYAIYFNIEDITVAAHGYDMITGNV
jgi:hypothetical protein